MARSDRLIRALSVAVELASSPFGVPLKTLADRHGWNLRTLYREVEALEAAGFKVQVDGSKYRLANWPLASEMGITAEEMVALFTARHLAAGVRHTSVGKALDRLWGKLTVGTKRSGMLVPPGPPPWLLVSDSAGVQTQAYKEHVVLLDEAVRGRRVVASQYRAPDGTETERDIEPNELYWDQRLETLYVIAWCRLRNDVRIFAAHRFRSLRLREDVFAPRAQATSRAALRSAFRVWRSEHVSRVRLLFSGGAASRVAERQWHGTQRLKTGPRGAELTLDVAGLEEIESWILSWGPEVLVRSPASLRLRIAARAAAIATLHGQFPAPRALTEGHGTNARMGAARRRPTRMRR